MRLLFHIIIFKIKTLIKILRQDSFSGIAKNIASFIVFVAFTIGVYYFTRFSVDYLLDTAKIGSFLLHRFLSMLLFVFFLSINVGNMIVSYATFYRSQEVQYYLTKPISYGQLFILKFFDNFFYSSTAFFLIAFAVVLGYGSHFNVHWTYYFHIMFLMLLPYMLIAGCIAVIILILAMQFSVYLSVRKIIGILILLYLILLAIYFSLTSPLKVVAAVLQHYPYLDQYFGYLDPPVTKYLPNYWISEALYWHMRGDGSYAFSYTILLLITTALTFLCMVILGRKLFYKSWISSLNLQNRNQNLSLRNKWYSPAKSFLYRTQSNVLIRKEITQFIREPSQWIHLVIISLLILTFLVSIANINLNQNMPFLQTISYIVVLLFNAFLIASIALRFIYPSLSIEGQCFWSILSAPVNRKKIIIVKFILWFLPLVILSEILVIFSHASLMDHPSLVLVASFLMLGTAYALVGLNFGAGAYFSDYREINPIRVASSQSATITFLMSIVFLILLVSFIFIPLNGFFSYILEGIAFNFNYLYLSTTGFFIISLIVGTASIAIAIKSVNRDF